MPPIRANNTKKPKMPFISLLPSFVNIPGIPVKNCVKNNKILYHSITAALACVNAIYPGEALASQIAERIK